ncbi:hypothetical protein U1Q18_036556 [Sarracenia purpurea var. burkii]
MKNKLDILSGLDAEQVGELVQASNVRGRAPRPCMSIVEDALNPKGNSLEHILFDEAHLSFNLLMMASDNCFDNVRKKAIISTVKKLKAVVKSAWEAPNLVDLGRMEDLEARILYLKGLCPITIKDYSNNLNLEESKVKSCAGGSPSPACDKAENIVEPNQIGKLGFTSGAFGGKQNCAHHVFDKTTQLVFVDKIEEMRDKVVTSEEGSETEEGVLEEDEDEDDETEYVEESSSRGEEAGVDDTSGDEDPAEICIKEKQVSGGNQRIASPLVREANITESTNASVLSCSQNVYVVDGLSPGSMDGNRKIQVGEKEGLFSHAHKVVNDLPHKVSMTNTPCTVAASSKLSVNNVGANP